MIKTRLKNLFGILQGFFVILLVLVVSLIIFTSFNPVKSIKVFRVMSGSMMPALKVGSIVFVQTIKSDLLKKNDIITYRSFEDPNVSVTHRLVSIEEKNGQQIFKTKGDANNAPDTTDISSSQITGKVVFSIPLLGYLSIWIKTPLGFGLLVILPALLIILTEILSIKKNIEIEVEKKYKNVKMLLLFLFIGISSLQIKTVFAFLSNEATISGTTFSAGCWVPPSIPSLVSPQDQTYAGATSAWTLNPIMDWENSTPTCPLTHTISYYYESYRDPSLSQLAYRSGKLSNSFIPAPGTPDGVYYWRVKACDSFNNCSAWSTVWKLTVDRISPTIPQNLHWNNPDVSCGGATNSFNITADWDNSTDLIGIQKYEYQITYPRLGGGTGVWNTFVTPSSYSGVFNQDQGLHTYKVRSYDLAGNISAWSSECSITYDTTPPTSLLDELPPSTNTPLTITYTADDNYAVNHTELCYSFNFNPWVCSHNFDFNFPEGQGIYYFDTIAHDTAGNSEKTVDNDPLYISSQPQILYDTSPPTTNIQKPTSSFSGQGLIGLPVSQTISGGQSRYFDFYLPDHYTGNLEFSYRFQSNDTALNDQFNVGLYFQDGQSLIKNILTDANNTGGLIYDTGWRSINHSLTSFANRLLRLVFEVTDIDPAFTSQAEIDNLIISSLDTRVGTTSPIDFISTDNLSDIDTTTPPTTPVVGENTVDFSAIDTAANIESTNSSPIVVLPEIVLNKINPSTSTVELFNNSSNIVDLSNYILDLGTTTILSGTIPANSSVEFTISLPDSGQLILKDNLSNDLDTVIYPSLLTASFERTVDGLGPWIKVNAPLSVNLESRLSVGKVTLSVSGVTPEITDINFILDYTVDSLPQQIVGVVNTTNRDLFLGTCSEGICLTPAGIGSSFVISLNYKNSGVDTTLPPVVFNL